MSNKLAVNSKNQDLSQAGGIVLLIIMREVVFAILSINHWYKKPDAGETKHTCTNVTTCFNQSWVSDFQVTFEKSQVIDCYM